MRLNKGAFSNCDNLNYNEYGNALYLGNSVNPYFALIMIKDSGMSACDIHISAIIIADGVFYGCTSLTSVVIPDSVTTIGSKAFRGCTRLTSVVIPDSVTSIGGSAFNDCNELVYNEYDNALYLGNSSNPYIALIKGKYESITSCVIHSDTIMIADRAFENYSSLTSVTIGNSVTSIGDYAINSERDFRKTQQKISNNIENSLQMIA